MPLKERARILQKYIEVDRSRFYYIDHLGSGPFNALLEMFPDDSEEDLQQFNKTVRFLIKDTIGRTTVAIEGKEINAFDYLVSPTSLFSSTEAETTQSLLSSF